MNILIYLPTISQDWGGVRQYAIGLLNTLTKDTLNHYYIYINNNDESIHQFQKNITNFSFINDNHLRNARIPGVNNFGRRLRNFLAKKLRRFDKIEILHAIDILCLHYKIDIIHCPYQYIPKTKYAKLITTLHDVQEIHFPEYFTPEQRASRATCYLDFLKRADKVIVSYNHVKGDLIKYFSVPNDKIDVVLLDMGKLWFERFSLKDALPGSKIGVPEKFILYPANTWEHKNHIRLIEAIAILRDEFNTKVTLICTGHLNDFYFKRIQNVLVDFKLQDQVLFLGVVNEQELFSLYKLALGIVVATTYEAGSFPLIESILLKVPVICSNVTSLPETVKNEKFLFNPFQASEIALKIKDLWESESFRKESIENSERVGVFLRKTNALEKFMLIYKQLENE